MRGEGGGKGCITIGCRLQQQEEDLQGRKMRYAKLDCCGFMLFACMCVSLRVCSRDGTVCVCVSQCVRCHAMST
jgi:hypothetical protein